MENNTQPYIFDSKEILGQGLVHLINVQLPNNSIMVELGTWSAQTTCLIAQKCNNISKIYTVDPYKPYYNYLEKINIDEKQIDNAKILAKHNIKYSGVSNKIDLIEKDGLDYVKSVEDNSIDIIFWDAEVDNNSLYKDLSAWYPKLKTNGIFSGHNWSGFRNIIIDFNKKVNGSNISVHDDVWVWIKK